MLIQAILTQIIYSALTLYMMAVLLRWTAPWLELDLKGGWLRWIPPVTDPPIGLAKRLLPNMGPMDWSPIAVTAFIWIIRIVLTGR